MALKFTSRARVDQSWYPRTVHETMGEQMTPQPEDADEFVQSVLLGIVDDTAPTVAPSARTPRPPKAPPVGSTPAAVPANKPPRQPKPPKPARPARTKTLKDGTLEVRAGSVAAATAEARRVAGDHVVLSGSRRRGFLRSEVVLIVRPAPPAQPAPALDAAAPATPVPVLRAPAPAVFASSGPDGGIPDWSRAHLRAVGAPRAFLGRLPLEDPETLEEWETTLLRLLREEMGSAAENPYVIVAADGPQGASALLIAAQAGLPLGVLGAAGARVTPEAVLETWRQAMPRARAQAKKAAPAKKATSAAAKKAAPPKKSAPAATKKAAPVKKATPAAAKKATPVNANAGATELPAPLKANPVPPTRARNRQAAQHTTRTTPTTVSAGADDHGQDS